MHPSTPVSSSLSAVARKWGAAALAASACTGFVTFAANVPALNAPAMLVAQATAPASPVQSAGARATAPGTTQAAAPSSASTPEAKPLWKDLTPEQQQSLKPLAANWSTLSDGQKRKWIALSRNFPAKAPAEQAKLHSRMTEWVSLSQQQRTQARLNFAEAKTLSRDEKTAQWKAYQALSPEEKQKLAAKGTPASAGATSAVKPVPEQRLAKVPATRHTQPVGTVAAHNSKVDAHTLLPLAPTNTADAVPATKN